MELTLRNASLSQLVSELTEQRDRKVDLLVPARDLWSHDGAVLVRGAGPSEMDDNGVTATNLALTPSDVFDGGVAAKLALPRAYVRTLRETGRTDILDVMFNRTLHGNDAIPTAEADARKFLLRTFKSKDGKTGYARALLSDSYKPIDNWDVLNAVVLGMGHAGLSANVVKSADLTDRRMYVKIVVPEINALAPELLKNYRSPFSGNRGADNPTVFAGLIIGNSETGDGAFTLTPRLEVEVCTNGMTMTADKLKSTHLGAKLEGDGIVQYSERTMRKNLELITSQTEDAVRTFLNVGYVTRALAKITEKAGEPVAKPQEIVTQITKREAFSKADSDGIMEQFIKGGDMTRGGVFQAITAHVQTLADADKVYAMEADAMAAAGI
jgi:hypothetical protein